MLFHKFLRALLEAWGRKPKGTTVWELLKEIIEGLPFGVKKQLVEIVPEQSVTKGEGNVKITASIPPVIGKEYTVLVNGQKHKIEAKSVLNAPPVFVGIGNASFSSPSENTGEPIFCMYTGTDFQVYWDSSLGETITLAIYGEQEVVKQLDAKFLPESTGGASGGGNGLFVVKINPIFDGEDFVSVSLDKTFEEIAEAVSKGFGVIGVCSHEMCLGVYTYTGYIDEYEKELMFMSSTNNGFDGETSSGGAGVGGIQYRYFYHDFDKEKWSYGFSTVTAEKTYFAWAEN